MDALRFVGLGILIVAVNLAFWGGIIWLIVWAIKEIT